MYPVLDDMGSVVNMTGALVSQNWSCRNRCHPCKQTNPWPHIGMSVLNQRPRFPPWPSAFPVSFFSALCYSSYQDPSQMSGHSISSPVWFTRPVCSSLEGRVGLDSVVQLLGLFSTIHLLSLPSSLSLSPSLPLSLYPYLFPSFLFPLPLSPRFLLFLSPSLLSFFYNWVWRKEQYYQRGRMERLGLVLSAVGMLRPKCPQSYMQPWILEESKLERYSCETDVNESTKDRIIKKEKRIKHRIWGTGPFKIKEGNMSLRRNLLCM